MPEAPRPSVPPAAPRRAAAPERPAVPPPPARPAVPRAFALLTPAQAHGPQQALPLRWDRSLVGRESASDDIHPEVDLSAFPDAGVSRRHAMFVRGELQTTLEDLGSANGTFINGQRLGPGSQHPVAPGDELRFGSLRFHFGLGPNQEREHS